MGPISLIIVLAVLVLVLIYNISQILERSKKIVHKLEYIETSVTVALRHKFTSVEEFKSWRNWRNEISQNIKSINK